MNFFTFSCVIFLAQNVTIPPNFMLLRSLQKESHNNMITLLEAVSERYSASNAKPKELIGETVPVATFSVLSDP